MDEQNFSILDLETHPTKDTLDSHVNGELTVIWRNWDELIHNPEMIYLNSVNPREIKGPHLHTKRTSYFYCLQGKMVIVIQDKDGNHHEIETDHNESKLICIPKEIITAIINPSDNPTKILVLADIAWKPNDNEMKNVNFDNYDLDKWRK